MSNNMKKGLYIVFGSNDFDEKLQPTTGVGKKIVNQVSSLNIENVMSCKLVIFPSLGKKNYLYKLISYLFLDPFGNINIDYEQYDFIYIRRFHPTSNSLIKTLKRIKENNPNCKIIYEIPTYPYDMEHYNNIKQYVSLLIDKIFRKKLSTYVDRVVTLSDDDKIFNIPTIKIINGVNCKDISIASTKTKNEDNIINLIAVGFFQFWHGYERLIAGLNEYYKYCKTKKYIINLHFVGDGPELIKYRKLVEDYNLENYVFFHGILKGKDLDNIYNICDIGVCSLACHRKNIFLSSELKSREYLAKGLPMISSTKIDVLPENFKYCYYVPGDDSPIDIDKIVKYYEDIYKNESLEEIRKNIREFAEKNIDISVTMKPVIEFILNDN
jgi:hypothetical protein